MTTAPMTRRLLRAYDRASAEHRADGERWYRMTGQTAAQLAAEHGTDPRTVAGMLAALSPRCQWPVTVKGARAMLEAAAAGRPEPIVAGIASNRAKAWAIATGADPDAVLGGPKVRAFYRNIAGDPDAVTVDVWAARAATGRRIDGPGRQYEVIATAYQRAAARRNIEPRIMQAIVWCAIRGSGSIEASEEVTA